MARGNLKILWIVFNGLSPVSIRKEKLKRFAKGNGINWFGKAVKRLNLLCVEKSFDHDVTKFFLN